MSTPATYPNKKQEPILGYVDRLDSNSKSSTSFTTLIAKGKNSIYLIQYTKSIGGSLRYYLLCFIDY